MTTDTETKPGRRQILLVDDDVAFTSMLKEFLLLREKDAWIVHTADNYAAALACLKVHSVDLVVLDIRMPVMDGLQFLKLLKQTRPGLQVVMLSSFVTEENRAYSLQNGAALFLDKASVADGFEKIYAALETVASTPTEGFRGVLRHVGLPDVLQMECLARKSSILEIAAHVGGGRIFIYDGSIIHAESGKLQGEQALFHLLTLSGGEFRLKPFAKPMRQTIDGHWESLLMEAARLRDEAAGGIPAESAGSVGSDGRESPASDAFASFENQPEAGNRHIEEVIICSGTSEVLYEWQAAEVERRVRLLDMLAAKLAGMVKTLPLGRADRLEVETDGERVIVLIQPDRKVFVRSAPTQAENSY